MIFCCPEILGVNFARLLGVLTELRTLGNINSEMCFSLKLKNKKLPPFLAEIWDVSTWSVTNVALTLIFYSFGLNRTYWCYCYFINFKIGSITRVRFVNESKKNLLLRGVPFISSMCAMIQFLWDVRMFQHCTQYEWQYILPYIKLHKLQLHNNNKLNLLGNVQYSIKNERKLL